MSQLTVRLPKTLHEQLRTLAKQEGTSLNQYIVYALTRQVKTAYTVQATSEQAISQQQAAFEALLQNLGQASPDEIKAVLAEREVVAPEEDLNAETIARLQQRLSDAKLTA